ncbi:MAG: peptidase S9 [Lysobacterales bacterium 13-68-4]|jgi:dipeptidyl aminopeptidase/acylaminoacyl peptidase|nr:MAG: peptidase S9 [Xanthomonadales bacterium 15-68-25]OZB66501.1 MAG: peptidase S9 [Xanthomonadales bacterium 14-68-21]OZB73324.1 MAG: peptidase S9 [Xanthomonadales bacterium 13-68-4]
MSRVSLLPLALLAGLTLPAFAGTAPVDPRIDHLLTELGKVRSIHGVQLSPDGRQLAWVVDTNGQPEVMLAKANGRDAHRLNTRDAAGSCGESNIAWAPDSAHLAFLSECASVGAAKGHPAVVVADTRGTAAPRKLAMLDGYAHALSWSPDGHELGFLYVEGATRAASAVAAAKPAAGEIGVDGLEVQRVAAVPATGGAVQMLTPAPSYVYEFSWSPDSRQLAYVAAPAPGDNNWWIAKLYAQQAKAGAEPRALVDTRTVAGPLHGLQMALPRWSPDGARVVFIGGLMSDQGATGGDLYAVPSAGGAVTALTPGIKVTPVWFGWTGADRLLVAQIRNGRSEVAPYAIDATHAKAQAPLFALDASIGDGTAAMGLSLSADHSSIAFAQSSYAAAPEVHAGKLGRTPPPAVTAINAALKPSWGKAESVEWDNEGRHVQGWLLYPAHYDAKQSYPMIVTVHGGPASAVLPRWPAVGFGGVPFSALDYFVFMPNPRGSYGQGEAYVQANRKDFGYGDLRDILAGVDTIEKKLPVDDKRLGLTGWSYGGFMSMFVPTQTQRFRAVVAGAGISNWQSYYGENLIDQWMIPYFGASVYDDPAVYAKSSAIHFIKQVKTPMLIVVGDRDAECPAPQSFEMWHALRTLGVPTSLVVYPNEGHHFVDPAHQRDVLQRALMWFEKYLPPGG